MTFNYSDISLGEYPGEISLLLYSPGCNMYCPWCFNVDLRNKKPITFKQAKDAIDEHRDFITAVVLTGGEPLYNPDLFKILKYIDDVGLKTKINTNGFISEQKFPWFTRTYHYIDYLHIALKDPNYCIWLDSSMTNCHISGRILEYSFVYIKECYPKPILNQWISYLNDSISDEWWTGFDREHYSRPDIFTISQLQVGNCLNPSFNDCHVSTREELIEIAKLFKNIPKKQLIIETKEYGRENIIKNI